MSFANCGLPYHVGGVIEDRESLLLQTPASLDRTVRARRARRTTRPCASTATAASSSSATSPRATLVELPYDALVLSPGARPVRPPIPGIERALSLRDIEDTDALVAATGGARTAVVIGGGFIGLEMAENLVHRGIDVTARRGAPSR